MTAGQENTARLLRDMLDAAVNDSEYEGLNGAGFNDLVWAQNLLLTLPPVVWGVGDTLSPGEKPGGYEAIRNWCLLPTTTSLDTQSNLVKAAKERFNAAHFEELKARAPAELGTVLLSVRGANTMDGLVHLVCRKPGNPEVKALDECLSNLPAKPGVRYVLPIWRAKEQLDLWVRAVARWVRPVRYAGLKARQPLLVLFEPDQGHLALEFERLLILQGVLIGRRGNDTPGVEIGKVDPGNALHADLAGLVCANGPLLRRCTLLGFIAVYVYRLTHGKGICRFLLSR